jgi:uncharacterized RDD family membrane protein YckC
MATEKLNTLTLRTPEGVFFSFQLASPITRFMAFTLDFFIVFTFTSVTGRFIALLSFISMDIVFALQILYFFIVSVGYGITLEWLLKGQTLGKKIFRLRVMDVKGLKLQFNQVVVRNLLRFVDSLPVFYLIGGIACLISKNAQRLGDIAANTIVIRTPNILNPDLKQILSDKYNSFRDYPHLEARLRQGVTADEAGIAIQALSRRDELDPISRIQLFQEIARHFKSIVDFPQEATDGLSDEQYIRNVAVVLFRDQVKLPK